MSINQSVTIGVAVRFEAPVQLRRFLNDLSAAAKVLDTVAQTEVIFCLNGALTETEHHVRSVVAELDNLEVPYRTMQSPTGKINAHRMIAQQRQHKGPILFVDADLEFSPETFRRLFLVLGSRPDVWACCAEVRALPSTASGLFQVLQNSYYARKHRLPARQFLHGRCFMLRDWIPELNLIASANHQTVGGAEHLNLARGPIVDDIHYSRLIVRRFGVAAIAQVPEADVRFTPPDSLAELYRDSFRTDLELERLNVLFPEHASLERALFRKRGGLRKCVDAIRLAGPLAATYVALEECLLLFARLQIRVLRRSSAHWKGAGHDHHGA